MKSTRKTTRKKRLGKLFLLCLICLFIGKKFLIQKQETLNVTQTEIYQEILNHPDSYPDHMAETLENNPELLEFVTHYTEYEPVVRGGLTQKELEEETPLFLQWDERWGYAPYGQTNIGFSGCGPTCLSMVIFSLTRNPDATPDAIAQYSMQHGFYVMGSGTSWDLMRIGAAEYGLSVQELGISEEEMKNRLNNGEMLIASMRPGDFTQQGHFIVIYGYDKKGFCVNDPNSRKRSEQRWSFDTLKDQIKNLWAYCNVDI